MALCRCSFCGRSQNDVPRLVASSTSTTAICSPCTLRVVEMFATDGDPEGEEPSFELTPIGREVAVRISGVARR